MMRPRRSWPLSFTIFLLSFVAFLYVAPPDSLEPLLLRLSQPSMVAAEGDADGDGIPDEKDLCPNLCNSTHLSSCSTQNFKSGRANDFDGDGCEDAAHDNDIDNDGIPNELDKCPRTPRHYHFTSNPREDFDGDGCADGVEDADNDNDGVHNAEDACPRTVASQGADSRGCSIFQRQLGENAQAVDPRWWEEQRNESSEQDSTWWDESYNLVRDSFLQVVVAGVLAYLLGKLQTGYEHIKENAPAPPDNSLKGRMHKVAFAGGDALVNLHSNA